MDNTQQPKPDRKRFAIASFVFGIVSSIPIPAVLFFFDPIKPVSAEMLRVLFSTIYSPILIMIVGLIGLILGIMGLKSTKRIFSVIGVTLCIISLLSGSFLLIINIFASMVSPH